MVAINFLNYLDRYVGAAIVTPIKAEFHLSDAQVGLLATAFLLVYAIAALPGLILAFLAFTMREPLRGSMEKVGIAVRRTTDAIARTFINLMRIPTLRAAILSQTVLYFVLASNAFWLPTVLHPRFDMSVTSAGLLSGGVLVAGGLIGTLAGGWIADRLAKTRPAAHLEVGIAGFLIGAVFITIALIAPLNVGPVPVFVPAFLMPLFALYLHSGPFTAVSQNVVSPALRARSATPLVFASHAVG